MRLTLLLAVFPALALAQIPAGIRNTRHDLSNSNATAGYLRNNNASENQICKYCHTPHRNISTQLLWQRTLSQATNWSWGNDLEGTTLTVTMNGTTLPTTIKAASRRCLTCHDGTTAVGDVANAGGGTSGVISGANFSVGASYDLIATALSMGGNHPISIPYAGQVGYNGITSSASASGNPGDYFAVVTGCSSTSGICTGAPATDGRNGDFINLVRDTPASTVYGVECVSCHEPHNKYGPNLYFTRVDVGNASGLCRSCHYK